MMNRKGLEWLILLSPFLFGLYFPWTAAAAVLFLLGFLFPLCRRGELHISISPLFFAAWCVVIFLFLGVFWGTDKGMALIGALQFLPLPLFVMAIEQLRTEERMCLLAHVPHAAACMVVLSIVMSRIPGLASWVIVNGRLGGFFQYPNTFALYLLAAMVILLWDAGNTNTKNQTLYLIEPAVLIAGIILSSSRTVLGLTAAVMLLFLLQNRGKKASGESGSAAERLLPGMILLAAVLALSWSVIRVVIIGHSSPASNASVSSSSAVAGWAATLLGRLLYARDAVPVILRHPLGLGYMGYASLQGSFQTGVYSVTHVHNDLLQLLLDAGWIPAVLMAAAIIRSFLAHDGNGGRKAVIAVICIHALLDFDLQYPAIAFLLLAAVSAGEREAPEKGKASKKSGAASAAFLAAGIVLCLFTVWLGTASYFVYAGNNSAAVRLYPRYTSALVKQLSERQNSGESKAQAELAERILRLNDSVAAAHDELALDAFSRGDMENAIREKKAAIALAKYDRIGYEEYRRILTSARQMYLSRGDTKAAAECEEELRRIPQMMQDVLNGTSRLGWMIPDRPDLPVSS